MSKIDNVISDLKRYNNNYIKSDILKKTNEKIWEYPEFSQWPGSIGNHHRYNGGLVVHTEEVWRYALNTASLFDADLDVLFTAILWHDLGKIWDYKHVDKNGDIIITKPADDGSDKDEYCWVKTDYHALIHHITGSVSEFTRHALNFDLDRYTLEKVQHCIAGHHGYPEWRSPVTPKSLEAKILHHSDMLSAFHGGTKDEL